MTKKTIKSYNKSELLKKINESKRSKVQAIKDSINPEKSIYGFWNYCKMVDPDWYLEKDRIDLKLVAVIFNLMEINVFHNLALSMPARRGKTHMINDLCSYAIGRQPDKSIIRTAYAYDLAEKSSKAIKRTIKLDAFKLAFDNMQLIHGNSSNKEWAVNKDVESNYKCAGVDGGVTGNGASNYIIGDDLIKNTEQGLSKNYQETLKNFLNETFGTRKEGNCKEIHNGTRWVEKDPIGNIIKNEKTYTIDLYKHRITEEYIKEVANNLIDAHLDKYTYVVVKIPALNKFNESTCEYKKSTEDLIKIRDRLIKSGAKDTWDSLYQQNPQRLGGKLFPLSKMKQYTEEQLRLIIESNMFDNKIMCLDMSGDGSNNTAAPIFIAVGDYYYLVKTYYSPVEPIISKYILADMVVDNKINYLIGEKNNLGSSVIDDIVEITDNKNYSDYIYEKIYVTTNKESRVYVASAWIKEHIILPKEVCNSIINNDSDKDIDEMYTALKNLNDYVALVKNQVDDLPDSFFLLKKKFGNKIVMD